MNLKIIGIGVWARGMRSYREFADVVCAPDATLADREFEAPRPEAIPPRERRRAGLMINLAVAAAHQACEHAGVDKAEIPSVFVSAMGDTDITDYMCRKLAQPEKLLSPTKFHNSVHNAPSGYWSISAENRAPSTFVGGYRESFGAGLLEAGSQALAGHTPVLLVAYDIANKLPFADITSVGETLACALVVLPADCTAPAQAALDVDAKLAYQAGDGADCMPQHPAVRALAASNPIGCALGLFESITLLHAEGGARACLQVPAAPGAALNMELSTARRPLPVAPS